MIVGIDTGLAGGVFVLDPAQPSTGEALDMPVHLLTRGGKSKREVDAAHQWGLVKHDGRAESALIALWGLRQPGLGGDPAATLRVVGGSEAAS